MVRFVTAAEAAEALKDGITVAVGGFGAYGGPDALMDAVRRRYLETGHPRGLTLVSGISCGDNTDAETGMNRLAVEGLADRLISGHLANAPALSVLAAEEKAAAHLLPLGVLMDLLRSIAGGRPGVITTVGLGTCADPRQDACRGNERSRDREVVRLMELDGKEYLFYPSFPIEACLVRGTYADSLGNISIRHEALVSEDLEMAHAVRASGGIVIVQVEEVLPGVLPAGEIRFHHSLVDLVVTAPPELHRQSYADDLYHPELTGEGCAEASVKLMPLTIRKVIARRAAMELAEGKIINLGIGLPSGVGSVAAEEGVSCLLSMESGPVGGVPMEGLGFGAAVNPEARFSVCDVFDLYDGGYLDVTFLGAGEIDREGNVNVSRFGGRCNGPGGFINITQSTKRVCFLCTFTVGGDVVPSEEGLEIRRDGRTGKFVDRVQQVTFSAARATETGQEVMYITERAVFRLTEKGLLLTEIAPGVRLQEDVLDRMAFRPAVAPDLKEMDIRLFRPGPMGLGKQ